MNMPRFYGHFPTQATALKSRDDFNRALRSGDQKLLLGLSGDDESGLSSMGMMGFSNVIGGVQTNRFSGYSDYMAVGTGKVWATAKSIDLIANVIISTETKLVNRDKDKNKKGGTIKVKPELLKLLQNPNPYDTISELLYLWVAHMKLTGNAFWLKDEVNGYGQPKAIYALNPRFIRIVPDAKLRVSHYLYRVNNHEIRFETEEIIHFRRPHANDPLWGLGDVEQAEALFDDYINRSLYNTRFMENGAMPSSVLVRESFEGNQDDWERMQSKFNEKYGGVKNTGKVAWMNGKWSVLQLGIDAQKMQDIEKSKANVQDIFLNHGVPLSVAGYGSANYATAGQEDRSFRRYGCMPLINLLVDALNSPRGFIDKFNPELKLDFALSGLIDVEQVMKEMVPLFDRGGLSPNDLRELAGQPRIQNSPYHDQYFVAANMVPIEIAGVTVPSEEDVTRPADDPNKPKPGSQEQNTSQDDGGKKPKPTKE